MAAPGLLLVDKPGGITSHDVVARARRALGTRKIGHAGTLDPMATGLLVLGVEGATRLLTFIVGLDKTYEATIRLGVATDTDDAEGQVVSVTDASSLDSARHRRPASRRSPAASRRFRARTRRSRSTGDAPTTSPARGRRCSSRPARSRCRGSRSSPSDGRGRHRPRCRRRLFERHVHPLARPRPGRRARAWAGTSRRCGAPASARSTWPGARRGRRSPTRPLLSPATAADAVLGRFDVTADEARDLRHGKRLLGAAGRLHATPAAAIDPDGRLVGVVERRGDDVKSAMNMPEEAAR